MFLVSHLAGRLPAPDREPGNGQDGGLGGDANARRALASHTAWYTAAFVPGLIWLGTELDWVTVIVTGFAIAIPHAILDDGRALRLWMTRVKRTSAAPGLLAMTVDQSFHILALFLLAVAVGT